MFKIFHADTLKEGIDIALKNRLYVSGWNMSYEMTQMRKRIAQRRQGKIEALYRDFGRWDPSRCAIILKYDEAEKPIGVCMRIDSHFEVFVRASQRGKGFGSSLVNMAKSAATTKLLTLPSPESTYYSFEGLRGTQKFWDKCGIKMR